MTNYNQIALTALELLRSSCRKNDELMRFIEDARQAVALSDRLICNVRSLTDSERIVPSELEEVEVVSSVVDVLDRISQNVGMERVRVQFITDHSRVYVQANELVSTVLFNILYSAINQIELGTTILLELLPNLSQGKIWWNLRFNIPAIFTENTASSTILDREPGGLSGGALGLLVSRIIVESFGGRILVYEQVSGINEISTIISVQLLGVVSPK
jgi:hypothetical protein